MSKKEYFRVTVKVANPAHESVAHKLATDAAQAVLGGHPEHLAEALGHPWVMVESIHVELPPERAEHYGWPDSKLSLADLAGFTGKLDCLEEISAIWIRKKGQDFGEIAMQSLAAQIEAELDETAPPANAIAIISGVDRAHENQNLLPPSLPGAPKTTRLWCRMAGAKTVEPSDFPNDDPDVIERLNLFRSASVSMADGDMDALVEGMRAMDEACMRAGHPKQAKKMIIVSSAAMALVGGFCESFEGMACAIERALSLDSKPAHKLDTLLYAMQMFEEDLSGSHVDIHPVASRIFADCASEVASMDPSRKVLGKLRKARRDDFSKLGDMLDNACARAESIIQRAELAKAAQKNRGRSITAIAPRRAFSL